MAALDEYSGVDLGVRMVLSGFFWAWYRQNYTTFTIPIKVWIIRVSITMQQLHPLFEALFGPEPTPS